jgi:hypothetical protein
VPDAICALTSEEWQVANDRYDGCALMCLENYQGRLIGNTNSECDRYGIALSAARLPGGFETAQHDAVVDVIASILTEAGPQPATVHPQGLFSQQVDPVRYPQLYDPERDQVSLRDIVPDIAFRTTTSTPIKYAEVKTNHLTRTRIPPPPPHLPPKSPHCAQCLLSRTRRSHRPASQASTCGVRPLIGL